MMHQLKRLGISYELHDAVGGELINREVWETYIDSFRFWCIVGRLAFAGEVGCKLSHDKARANKEEVFCILEDDAILAENFIVELGKIEKEIDISKSQVVLLSHGDRELLFADGYVMTRKAAEAIKAENTPMKCPCDYWWYWKNKGIIDVWHHPIPVVSQDIHQTTIGRSKSLCQMNTFEKIWWKMKRVVGKILLLIIG